MLIEALNQKFGQIPNKIEKGIKSIKNHDDLKFLIGKLIITQSIQEFNEFLYVKRKSTTKDGLDFKQNIDAVVKWLTQEFKGRTLEIFDIETMPIIEVFNFEPVDIAMHTGRIDVMLRDEVSALYHLEEQRDMKIEDLYRFSVNHFQAVRQYGNNITDVILISGQPYQGKYEIETSSGTYYPMIIDLTEKDGWKSLEKIKKEVYNGEYQNLMELIFIPLYGKYQSEERNKLALEVLNYEVKLIKSDKLMSNLFMATIIMSNKIVDKELLKSLYEEVKNMLDLLDIAREDGMEKGMNQIVSRLVAKKFNMDKNYELPLLAKLSKEDILNLAEEIFIMNSIGAVHSWINNRIQD